MKTLRNYWKHILFTLLLVILPSNYSKSSTSTQQASDSTKKAIGFNPVAYKVKGDTLICLTNQEALIAYNQIKQIPTLKRIIKSQDTVICLNQKNLIQKDSIIKTVEISSNQKEEKYIKEIDNLVIEKNKHIWRSQLKSVIICTTVILMFIM